MRFDGFRYDPKTGRIYRPCGKPLSCKPHSSGYLYANIGGKHVAQHRLAWFLQTGEWPPGDIDHCNRNKADNRWKNLRLATRKQNCENRKVYRNNVLGVRGIRYRPRDRLYEPRMMHHGRRLNLGLYKTLWEAVEARKKAEQQVFTHAI